MARGTAAKKAKAKPSSQKIKRKETKSEENENWHDDEGRLAAAKMQRKGALTADHTAPLTDSETAHLPPIQAFGRKRLLSFVGENRNAIVGSCAQRLLSCSTHPRSSRLEEGALQNWFQRFQLKEVQGPWSERCTALEWHPHLPHLLAVGSKWGSFHLWDVTRPFSLHDKVDGYGAGNSVGALRFDPKDDNRLVAALMGGAVISMDIQTKRRTALLSIDIPELYKRWYVSADVSPLDGLVVAGDSKGYITATLPDGSGPVWRLRCHSGKVHHVEMSARDPWLMASASTDHSVRLWDIRLLRPDIKNRPQPLLKLSFEHAINIASFSVSGSRRLLVADQKDRIWVYQGPSWAELVSWPHPHRQFQHLTPIRPSWFPLSDVVVIGRYPEDNELPDGSPALRTIDLFQGATGKLLAQLRPPSRLTNKIVSIAKFNCTGDRLGCAMGSAVELWRPVDEAKVGGEAEDWLDKDIARRRPPVVKGVMVPRRPPWLQGSSSPS